MTGMDLQAYLFAITDADGETALPVGIAIPDHHHYSDEKPPLEGTPVHQLPVEVLREIFIYVPMMEFHESTHGSTTMSLWPSASQVCSLWRRITLGTREFWTFVPLQTRHTNWIDLALARSNPLPISLNLNGALVDLAWYRRALMRVAPMAWRAREIYAGTAGTFSGRQEEFQDQLVEEIGAHPFPFLEVFESSDVMLNVPRFGDEVPPKLRRVKFFACHHLHHSWTGLRAPLTYLELSECHGINALRALRHLPTLQILILSDAYKVRPSVTATNPVKIPLPNLIRLEFHNSDYTTFVEFMHYVHIPSSAEIDFRDYGDLSEGNIPDMVASLTAVFSGHLRESLDAGLCFQNISIHSSQRQLWSSECALQLSNPTPQSNGRSPSLPGRITCDINGPDSFPSKVRLIPRILPILGPIIRKAQTLDASGPGLLYLKEWVDISRSVGQVSQINVHGGAAHGIVLGLASTATPAPFFPHLETLSIKRVNFRDEVDERPVPLREPGRRFMLFTNGRSLPEARPEDSAAFIDGLLQALASRAAAGHPIKRLVVTGCSISTGMVQSLRDCRAIDSVEWDGRGESAVRSSISISSSTTSVTDSDE